MSIPGAASPLFLAATAAGPAGGFEISRSLRFNSADSAYLNRTPSSAGNRKTWTWSGWLKRGKISSEACIFTAGSGTANTIRFNGDDRMKVSAGSDGTIETVAVFRDPSAWYNIVVALDTTQATASDRLKIYVNSVLQDVTGTYPTQNSDGSYNEASVHYLGRQVHNTSNLFDGYLAEINFIDGQALAPTDFGETDDNGVWQAKDTAGLSFGTNGFRLKFADNSSNAALGTDSSGNSNTWTVNNLVAVVNEINASNSEITNNGVSNHLNIFDGDITTTVSSADGGTTTWTPSSNISISKIEGYFDDSLNGYRITMSVSGGSSQTITLDTSSGGTANQWNEFTSLSGDTIGPSNAITFSMLRPAGNDTNPGLHDLNALRINDKLVVLNSSGAGIDSLVDSPTNGTASSGGDPGGSIVGNYATFNPLSTNITGSASLSNGNLSLDATSATYINARSTIAASSLNCYCEMTVTTRSNTSGLIGIGVGDGLANIAAGTGAYTVYRAHGGVIQYPGNVTAATVATYTVGDVIGMAISPTEVAFYKNSALQGTYNHNLTGDYFVTGMAYNNGGTAFLDFNFGQRPFVHAAPSGYKSLNTANLPTPTIADGSQYFDTLTWAGNAATRTLSGLDLTNSVGLAWVKNRTSSVNHALQDVVRGFTTGKKLASNTTDTEGSTGALSDAYGYISGVSATGLTITKSGTGQDWVQMNNTSNNYVGWVWDAGTSTVTNNDGSIASSVRANPSAGFSIVSYDYPASGSFTVGHGLNSAPAVIIYKNRNRATSWFVYHSAATSKDQYLTLSGTNAVTAGTNFWGANAPTNAVFGSTVGVTGISTDESIAYCFTPVAGYSAFGSYTGNGNADGSFVFTGFKIAYLVIKCTSHTSMWSCWDTARDVDNFSEHRIRLDQSNAEESGDSNLYIDLLSNGFKARAADTDTNGSGRTYVYLAFASNPFQANGGLAR